MNNLNKMRITDIALSKLDTAYQAGKGGKDAFKKYAGQECIMDFADGLVEAVIQAYLKDIWKPFDKDDENTWPEKYNSHSRSLLVLIDGNVSNAYWSALNEDFTDDFTSEVTHYLDPADIIPEERT